MTGKSETTDNSNLYIAMGIFFLYAVGLLGLAAVAMVISTERYMSACVSAGNTEAQCQWFAERDQPWKLGPPARGQLRQ